MAPDKKKSKSALKGGGGGLTVSAAKAFIGPHPDCGSMRLVLQVRQGHGRTAPSPGVRLHPNSRHDPMRTGCIHVNLWVRPCHGPCSSFP